VNMDFLRQVSIYRPYATEVPLPLFEPGLSAGCFDDAIAALQEPARPVGERGPLRVQELLFMRVAKHSERQPDEAVAAYVIRAQTTTCFELQHLLVDPHFRGRGLGSESKGARQLVVHGHSDCLFLQRYGFQTTDTGWSYTFTPE